MQQKRLQRGDRTASAVGVNGLELGDQGQQQREENTESSQLHRDVISQILSVARGDLLQQGEGICRILGEINADDGCRSAHSRCCGGIAALHLIDRDQVDFDLRIGMVSFVAAASAAHQRSAPDDVNHLLLSQSSHFNSSFS